MGKDGGGCRVLPIFSNVDLTEDMFVTKKMLEKNERKATHFVLDGFDIFFKTLEYSVKNNIERTGSKVCFKKVFHFPCFDVFFSVI